MPNIQWTFIYGTSEHNPALMEAARFNTLKAWHMVVKDRGIMVLDRYGIESDVMRTCQVWNIPLLVVGTTARPASGVSMKYYERAVLPNGTAQEIKARLSRYALRKSERIVIIGNTPDCRAIGMYAGLLDITALHAADQLERMRYLTPSPERSPLNSYFYQKWNIVH